MGHGELSPQLLKKEVIAVRDIISWEKFLTYIEKFLCLLYLLTVIDWRKGQFVLIRTFIHHLRLMRVMQQQSPALWSVATLQTLQTCQVICLCPWFASFSIMFVATENLHSQVYLCIVTVFGIVDKANSWCHTYLTRLHG